MRGGADAGAEFEAGAGAGGGGVELECVDMGGNVSIRQVCDEEDPYLRLFALYIASTEGKAAKNEERNRPQRVHSVKVVGARDYVDLNNVSALKCTLSKKRWPLFAVF